MNIFLLPLKAPKQYEEFVDKIRNFYKSRNYTEVFTPILQDEPNLEKYIEAIECDIESCGEKKYMYLHTSPERSMKTLLKEYKNNIFQITKVFRNKECGSKNSVEFTMLECYNVENLDVKSEIKDIVFELLGEKEIKYTPFHEAFEKYTGVVFSEDEDILKNNLISFGYEFDDKDSWEDIVDKMLSEIQSNFGKDSYEFIIDFPCKMGVLSKCKGDTSERFELFIEGIEIANGWIEESNFNTIKSLIQEVSKHKNIRNIEDLAKDYHNDFEYAGYSIGIDRLFSLCLTSPSKKSSTSLSGR